MLIAARLAASELRRFRGRLPLLALGFLLLVPTLYGSLYLWSNWDPYGRSRDIPVAVVNEDEPVTVQGRRVDAGAQFVQQLRAGRELDWRFTDAADARAGLNEGRYLMIVAVPREFSSRLAGPATGSFERARLLIRLDDANGYSVSVIARTLQGEIQNQVDAAAYAAYAEVALGGLQQIRDGLSGGAGGASRLSAGAVALRNGSARLASGLDRLQAGAATVKSGSAQVRDGNQQLAGVVDAAAGAVGQGLDRLGAVASLAGEAADVAGQLSGGVQGVSQVSGSIDDQVAALVQANPSLANDPAFRQLQQLTAANAQAAGQTAADVSDAATRLSRLADQAQGAAGQAGAIRAQVRQGKAGVDRLAQGSAAVAAGAARLSAGVTTAAQGADRLAPGASALAQGGGRLAGALAAARDRVPASDPGERASQADALANPVQLVTSNAHPAKLYGRGLAPFFLSIALWVFSLIAYLLLRPVAGEALASRLPAWTVGIGAWLPAAGLGTVAALILYAVLDAGLGLDPLSPWATLGLMFLAVAAFTAIDHFLRLTFGVVGDAVSLVLLVLQLAAAGGIYPIQTAPAALQAIHPFLPMTYLIDGLRITISGGDGARLARDALILAALLAAMLSLTAWTVERRRMWTIARLKPELEL
jgi:putative membrane protein